MISQNPHRHEGPSRPLKLEGENLAAASISIPGPRDEGIFESRLNLLITAVRHELSNDILVLNCVLDQNKPDQFGLIVHSIHRLFALAEIVHSRGFSDGEKQKVRFTAAERHLIELGSNENFDNLGSRVVRNLIRREASFIKQHLEQIPLEAILTLSQEEQNRLERLMSFQRPLLDSLISLAEGRLEIFAPDYLHRLSLEKKQLLIGLRAAAMEFPIEVTHPGVDPDTIQLNIHPIVSILIFGNLLSNAAEAQRAAGCNSSIRFEIGREGDFVSFTCIDQGIGMSAQVLRSLNSGRQTSSKTDPGLHGIGFAYARELAKQAGGNLYIDWSAPGQGTRAKLLLPCQSV